MVAIAACAVHMPSTINIAAMFVVQEKKRAMKSPRIKLVQSFMYISRIGNELQFISCKRIK